LRKFQKIYSEKFLKHNLEVWDVRKEIIGVRQGKYNVKKYHG